MTIRRETALHGESNKGYFYFFEDNYLHHNFDKQTLKLWKCACFHTRLTLEVGVNITILELHNPKCNCSQP